MVILYLQVTLIFSTKPAYNFEHRPHVSTISAKLDNTLLDTNSMHCKISFRSSYMMWEFLEI